MFTYVPGGSDQFVGRLGEDTLDFSRMQTRLRVLMDDHRASQLGTENTTYALFWETENIVGGSVYDDIGGDANANRLDGGPGADTLLGGAGNDVLVYDAADASVDGGADTDTLRTAGSGTTLDLTLIPDTRITNLEVIDITGTGNNSAVL